MADQNQAKRAKRKTKTGIVVSDKMQKTVVVEVKRTFRHPFYLKVVRSSKRYKAHDETNQCSVGDVVEIMETRPISREKRWRVVKTVGKTHVKFRELPKKRKAEEVSAEVPVPENNQAEIGENK